MKRSRIAFPRSLDIVVWLNLAAGVLYLVDALMAFSSADLSGGLVGLAGCAISFLIVVGILRRSRIVRLLVLILAWIGAINFGLLLVVAFLTHGLRAAVIAVSFSVDVVTIWGLMNASSRRYFGVLKN
jgi:hypothetical protein